MEGEVVWEGEDGGPGGEDEGGVDLRWVVSFFSFPYGTRLGDLGSFSIF